MVWLPNSAKAADRSGWELADEPTRATRREDRVPHAAIEQETMSSDFRQLGERRIEHMRYEG